MLAAAFLAASLKTPSGRPPSAVSRARDAAGEKPPAEASLVAHAAASRVENASVEMVSEGSVGGACRSVVSCVEASREGIAACCVAAAAPLANSGGDGHLLMQQGAAAKHLGRVTNRRAFLRERSLVPIASCSSRRSSRREILCLANSRPHSFCGLPLMAGPLKQLVLGHCCYFHSSDRGLQPPIRLRLNKTKDRNKLVSSKPMRGPSCSVDWKARTQHAAASRLQPEEPLWERRVENEQPNLS